MKKLILFLVVAALALGMTFATVGCQTETKKSSSSESSDTTKKTT